MSLMQTLDIKSIKEKKNNFSLKLLFFISLFSLVIAISTPQAHLFAIIGVCLFVYFVLDFTWLTGTIFPISNLFCILLSLQMLVGPFLAYYWFPNDGPYYMRVDDDVYFSYAFPAMIAFTLGISIFSGWKKKIVDIAHLQQSLFFNKKMVYIMIGIGIFFYFLEDKFGSSFSFVFVLLGCLRYIGLFILILTQPKFPRIETAIVYGLILWRGFTTGMFHDLLTWGIFFGIVLALRYKPSFKFKLLVFLGAILGIVVLQSIKESYRSRIYSGQESVSSSLDKAIDDVDEESGIFSNQNLSNNFVVRINQGWILSSALINVPASLDHTRGTLTRKYLEAATMPRFLVPDKLTAGNQQHFMTYSGVEISESTSMGLGIFADAYIEFGAFGGWMWLFFYGLMYNLAINVFFRTAKNYPYLILFMPMVFLYSIRPDCETQTALGHFIKSAFIVFLFHQYMKSKLPKYKLITMKHSAAG